MRNFSWTLLGNLSYAFVKWIILLLFVRMVSGEEVGMYSFALAVSAPFFLFSNLRLRSVYVVKEDIRFKEFILIRIIFISLALIIMTFISVLFFKEYIWAIMFVSIIKGAELFSDFLYALPHKRNRLDVVGKILVVKSAVILIVTLITLITTESFYITLGIYAAISVIFILYEYNEVKFYQEIQNQKISLGIVKYTVLSTLPLGFVQFLSSINASLPKYFLEFIEQNIELIGIFTSITYLMVVANLVMSSLSQTYLVTIKELIKLGKLRELKYQFLNKALLYGIISGIVLGLLAILFGEKFLYIIYGSNIAEYSHLLIIVAFGFTFTFLSWTSDTILMAFEYYKIQPIIAILVFILGLLTTIVLISNSGLTGAAVSLLMISFYQAVLKYSFSLYFIHIRSLKL